MNEHSLDNDLAPRALGSGSTPSQSSLRVALNESYPNNGEFCESAYSTITESAMLQSGEEVVAVALCAVYGKADRPLVLTRERLFAVDPRTDVELDLSLNEITAYKTEFLGDIRVVHITTAHGDVHRLTSKVGGSPPVNNLGRHLALLAPQVRLHLCLELTGWKRDASLELTEWAKKGANWVTVNAAKLVGVGLLVAIPVAFVAFVIGSWQSPQTWEGWTAPLLGIIVGVAAGIATAVKTESGCVGFGIAAVVVGTLTAIGLQNAHPRAINCPAGYSSAWHNGEKHCYSPQEQEDARMIQDAIDELRSGQGGY